MRRTLLALCGLAALGIGLARRPAAPVSDAFPRSVAILGDSVAHGAGDESGHGGIGGALPIVRVTNLGIDGARTWTVLAHLRQRTVRDAVRHADAIVLSIGGNDLFGDGRARLLATFAPELAMQRAAGRVRRVVGAIRRENGRARIYLLGLYNPYRAAWLDPHVARWDSRLIAAFARTRAVTVIRIADLIDQPWMLSPVDHFHPSALGYRAIAQRIAAAW